VGTVERGRSGTALRGSPQIYAWKKQLQEQAARAFDAGADPDGEASRDREIEKLHAKIGS
jgi:hypothetical protein